MNSETKAAVENLMRALFVELLELARMHGITVKRMRELLPITQLQALEKAGCSQGEMVAESGYTRKSIRKILATPLAPDCVSPVDRFIADWHADPQFPEHLVINGDFPSFYHLHDKYGGEFTAPGLLRMLIERGLVQADEERVVLDPKRVVTAQTGPDMLHAAQCSLVALFRTLRHNMAVKDEPFTERRVWSPNIPREHIAGFREEAKQVMKDYRQLILDMMEKYQVAPDKAKDYDCPNAVGVGMYWYEINP